MPIYYCEDNFANHLLRDKLSFIYKSILSINSAVYIRYPHLLGNNSLGQFVKSKHRIILSLKAHLKTKQFENHW